jgi:LacI family transcriptional regulator
MDIREIAKRAGVSTATVSRTMNRNPTVDPKLAKKVWRVVDEIGYYPNTHARALVSGKSRLLGLIVSEITNPFFPELVQSFEEVAVENGYEILLTSTVHDPKRMEMSVRRMIERRVQGVAILTFGFEEALIDHFQFRNLPVVFVDVGPRRPRVTNIRVNYMTGIRRAIQHLAALRHQRIAFITGPLELRSAVARKECFERAMDEIGLKTPSEYIVAGDHTIDGGMRSLTVIEAMQTPPTAVLCSNDVTAIGVMREAYDCGLSIPDDLSIIGFDDIRLSQFMTPPLTTIRMSQTDLARLAFQALAAALGEDVSQEPREIVLETDLILRRSTALAAKSAGSRVAASRAKRRRS